MATKAKGSKKKAAKKTGKRNTTPKLSCSFVADLTTPHTTESSGKLATKVAEVAVAIKSWRGEVRKAFADGTDLPVFPVKAYADPNKAKLTRKVYEGVVDEHTEAIEAGTKPPVLMPRYNPVLVDLIHLQHCVSLRRGAIADHLKPPKDWDAKHAKLYGSWYHEWEEDGETVQEASGWFFDKEMPRRCHAARAEILIEEPGKNILTFGNLRVVVGTGTHDGSSIFMVNQTSHGNYRAGDKTRKRLSLAGIKEIRNIVFKIEDRPNNEGGFTVKGEWDSYREMVYMPGQVLTAGFLFDKNGKQIDAKTIRGLDGETKGLRFKALEAPIVGKVIPWDKLWAEIKVAGKESIKKMRERGGRSEEYEAGSVETRSITNICVNGKRVDPGEANAYGMRGSQINMPAFIVATGEGKIENGHFGMGVVIGARANAPWNVGVHAAKGEGEVEEVEEVEEAPKAAKPKADPKAKAKAKPKPKVEPKSRAAKLVAAAAEEAPPVESDTADEEVVENETADVDETVSAE